MRLFSKDSIRKSVLDIRNKHKINHNSILKINKRFLTFLQPYLHSSSIVAAYYPILSEVDIRNLLEALYKQSITILLPVIENEELNINFYPYSSDMKMKPSKFFTNILEPETNKSPLIPDIVIAPLIACDIQGNRIGSGKGIYDKKIAELRTDNPKLIYIGLCYDFQLLEEIPKEIHDQKLNIIITEKRSIKIDLV